MAYYNGVWAISAKVLGEGVGGTEDVVATKAAIGARSEAVRAHVSVILYHDKNTYE
jgi:hypothetical protein